MIPQFAAEQLLITTKDFADAVEAYLVHGEGNLPLWIATARRDAAAAEGDKEEVSHQLAEIAKIQNNVVPIRG